MRDYFAKKLGADLAQWQKRFVDYGRKTLEQLQATTLDPKNAPAYVVQHYAAHLARAHAPVRDFAALVCGEWAQAWDVLDGTYAGFLNDVGTVWAQALPAHAVGVLVRCALFQSTLHTLNHNVSGKLLGLAITNGVLTLRPGLIALQQVTERYEAFRRMVAVAAPLSDEQLRAALALAETMGGWLPHWGLVLLREQAQEKKRLTR